MWSDHQTALLVAILDELIPPGADGRIPGAGQAGIVDFLGTATSYATDPAGSTTRVLDYIENLGEFITLEQHAKVAALKRAEQDCGEAFATLVRLTYMGYYSRPEIRPLFGVGAHPVQPIGYGVAPESDAEISELTAPVRSRGAAYRDV